MESPKDMAVKQIQETKHFFRETVYYKLSSLVMVNAEKWGSKLDK